VIESKHEYENLAASVLADGDRGKVERVLDRIAAAPQLLPLTKEEIEAVVLRVQELHGRAYGWDPRLEARDILGGTEGRGYLLRTRIRAAIELLDQLYQYGKAGSVQIDELGQASFEEDVPALDGLLDGE